MVRLFVSIDSDGIAFKNCTKHEMMNDAQYIQNDWIITDLEHTLLAYCERQLEKPL